MNVILCGPSGVGKTTIINELLKNEQYKKYTSVTTREMRDGEVNGDDYWFYSIEEFYSLVSENKIFNVVEYNGISYGTVDEFPESVESLNYVLSAIIPSRALEYKKSNKENNCIIYVLPPDLDTLTKRCRGRNIDRIDADIANIEYAYNFDFSVISDDLNISVNDIMRYVDYFNRTGISKFDSSLLDKFKDELTTYSRIRKKPE